MTTPSKREIRREFAEVRRLINEWDPTGVIGDAAAPPDEYDCLVGPVLSLLTRGASESDVAGFLRSEIEEHFGLDPRQVDVDGVAKRLAQWFEERPTTESPESPRGEGEH